MIYAQEGRDSFSGPEAVALMGYNGLNGASRRALGAVRGFGLVEGRGQQLRVSADAVLIIADTGASDQSERQAALLRCLRHNRIFADLHERFGVEGAAQELSGFLQKRYQFKPFTADRTAQVFRDSLGMLAVVGKVAVAESSAPAGRQARPFEQSLYTAEHSPQVTALEPGSLGQNLPIVSTDNSGIAGSWRTDSGRLGRGDREAAIDPVLPGQRQDSFIMDHGTAVLSWPKNIGREEFEDFTDWLLLEHRKISRCVQGEECPVIGRLDPRAKE